MEFKGSRQLDWLPLLLSLALGAFVAIPAVRSNVVLFRTFLIVPGILAAWSLVLATWMNERGRTPQYAVALLKQHYLQASVHASILTYWGWYYRAVYDEAYLILAQLVFAYAFDMLLQLTRHGRYTLGFGPFPVIFSTNLFLWFVDDSFYFQFLLVAVGLAVKELVRWNRGGKSVHIFNPSSFPLAVACWILLAIPHGFDITWGELIAGTQFRPPHIFLFIFLVSLPGQFFFGVTTMTLAAVVTMYTWAAAYLSLTGSTFHFEAYIPIAVFLAMNLLFTDPSTSPRSQLGRILFGIAYATTVIGLELLVDPAFPSKLLLVPALNLAVPLFDRVAESKLLRSIDPARIAPWLLGRSRNLAYISVWAIVFFTLTAARGIGDSFWGQELPFWQKACVARGGRACHKLVQIEAASCHAQSAWACNEDGITRNGLGDIAQARGAFRKGCTFGSPEACTNISMLDEHAADFQRRAPTLAEYPKLLSIFKSARRDRLLALPDDQLLAEACSKGWASACSGGGKGAAATAGN